MNKIFYKFFSFFLRLLLRERVDEKRFLNFDSRLRYKAKEHLMFFFQKEISYENELFRYFSSQCKNPRMVFDIGANIGQYSIRLAESFPDAQIISCEPAKKTYAHLLENIKLNEIKNIMPLNVAVSDATGKISFKADILTGGRSSKVDEAGDLIVNTTTIGNLINEYGAPDLIKIDTEGHELKVLNTQSKNQLIYSTIMVEVTGKNNIREIFSLFSNTHSITYIEKKIMIKEKVDLELILKRYKGENFFGNFLLSSEKQFGINKTNSD